MFLNEIMMGLLETYLEEDNRYGESSYAPPVVIPCVKTGSSHYKREMDNESVQYDYVYQTRYEVKEKDKLDGYIVNKVIDRYDIYGVLRFREVFVING